MMILASSDHGLDALALLREAAIEAGRIAMASFRPGTMTSARIWSKDGGSPVTEADLAADAFLRERLMAALPAAGWLSEETADDPARLARDLVFIVDPIDGTRAFLSGDPNWSVSVALVANGEPVAGVVHAPALDLTYEATRGKGATINSNPLSVSARASVSGARVAGPKPLVDRLARHHDPLERLPKVPSLALRLARVAAGEIEIGLVSAAARDWDIAAADLILREAGGLLTTLEGDTPPYNTPETIHGPMIGAGAALHEAALRAITL
jgi:myo-inositol-1(or 4)-monophosphatase